MELYSSPLQGEGGHQAPECCNLITTYTYVYIKLYGVKGRTKGLESFSMK